MKYTAKLEIHLKKSLVYKILREKLLTKITIAQFRL